MIHETAAAALNVMLRTFLQLKQLT